MCKRVCRVVSISMFIVACSMRGMALSCSLNLKVGILTHKSSLLSEKKYMIALLFLRTSLLRESPICESR